MSWKKGAERTIVEKLQLLIYLVLTIAALAFVYSGTKGTLGIEEGCSDHTENPYACIRDSKCRPADDGGDVKCIDAVRKPNHRYNAPQDADCVCPESFDEVTDGNSKYYGMCHDGNDYTVCVYPPQEP